MIIYFTLAVRLLESYILTKLSKRIDILISVIIVHKILCKTQFYLPFCFLTLLNLNIFARFQCMKLIAFDATMRFLKNYIIDCIRDDNTL